MNTKSTTLQDALTSLNLTDTSGDMVRDYQAAGTLPQELLKHTVKKEYILLGMTPKDFIKEHGSTVMDFEDLKKKFKEICMDYLDPLSAETPSKAVEFCSKIIYEVGPEARQVRKKDGDKTWRFVFPYKEDNTMITKVAFVSTYKEDGASYEYTSSARKITLSVKSASLLSLLVVEDLNKMATQSVPPLYLLTPLAGAIFSKDDIDKIADELEARPWEVANSINASCQSGGQNIPDSKMYIAAVATIVATRNVKDHKMRDGIIGKTMKQYLNTKKEWNPEKFTIYARYGHGGVPSHLSPENLIQLFESIQKVAPLAAQRASQQTAMTSIVIAPKTIGARCASPRKGPPSPS